MIKAPIHYKSATLVSVTPSGEVVMCRRRVLGVRSMGSAPTVLRVLERVRAGRMKVLGAVGSISAVGSVKDGVMCF